MYSQPNYVTLWNNLWVIQCKTIWYFQNWQCCFLKDETSNDKSMLQPRVKDKKMSANLTWILATFNKLEKQDYHNDTYQFTTVDYVKNCFFNELMEACIYIHQNCNSFIKYYGEMRNVQIQFKATDIRAANQYYNLTAMTSKLRQYSH